MGVLMQVVFTQGDPLPATEDPRVNRAGRAIGVPRNHESSFLAELRHERGGAIPGRHTSLTISMACYSSVPRMIKAAIVK